MMQVDVQEDCIIEKTENDTDLLLIIGYLKEQYKDTDLLQLDKQSDIIDLIRLFSDYLERNENGSDHEPKQDQNLDDHNNEQIEEKKVDAEPEPTPTPEPMDIISESSSSKPQPINRIIRANKSMEPTVLLVDGYIREQSQTLNLSITIVISDIIQQFYQKMKGTTFVWHITNKKSKLLTKMLQSTQQGFGLSRSSSSFGASQPYYDSDLFSVQTRLQQPPDELSTCTFCDDSNTNKLIGTHVISCIFCPCSINMSYVTYTTQFQEFVIIVVRLEIFH